MTIKRKSCLRKRKVEIDISGPDGNGFVLLGYARQFARDIGKDEDAIAAEMTSGNYEHLLEVFDREFGFFVTLYR